MNKDICFSHGLTVSSPVEHAPILLRLVTCERLGVVNGLMEANCALSLESDDILCMNDHWDLHEGRFYWVMTSAHDLAA